MARRKVTKQSVRATSRRQKEDRRRRQRQILNYVVFAIVVIAAIFVVVVLWLSRDGGEEGSVSERRLFDLGERPLAELDPAARNDYYSSYPETVIEDGKTYEAAIRTEKGDMLLALYADKAPLTVNSFVFLASQGYFDGTTFHRVIEDFMAQGGDPTGTGSGGPGYEFEDETDNGLTFDRPGLLAMANRGPATNGSQFFITFEPVPRLNGVHTIFGELIDGEDVLNSLTFVEPGGGVKGDVIERIDIYER